MQLSDYIPAKANQDCSLVYLLDEDLCLSTSLELINYNVASLTAALIDVESYTGFWNSVYTNFTANSATWLVATSHLKMYNELWSSAYTIVQSLSSTWKTEFTVYHPIIALISDYYNDVSKYKEAYRVWLSAAFPAAQYADGQIINVQVNLYHNQPFSFVFGRQYTETCAPEGGVIIECKTCARPHRGCNHHGGAAGNGPCDNAYSHCGVVNKQLEAKFSCTGQNNKDLKISYNLDSLDTSVARIVTIKYEKYQNNWRLKDV